MEHINILVKKITPLYNEYKQSKKDISGTNALMLMWDIGDILKTFTIEFDIAPHNLFRQIYGKSEGAKNVIQKSYITREFQSRCFRIRNIFFSKSLIVDQLPSLRDFTSFREAMPFFDNEIYKLGNEEFVQLLKLLNSKLKTIDIVKQLEIKKKGINNITNSRDQKLKELDNEKMMFIDFYNYLYQLKKEKNYYEALSKLGISDIDLINLLAKNTSALAQEGVIFYEMAQNIITNEITHQFYMMLQNLLKSRNEKERRRFRRVIKPERIIKLAEMIYSFTSENQFFKPKM